MTTVPRRTTPLCVDCAYHSKELGHHRCSWRTDPVTGGPGGFADLERRYVINGSCGINGTNFKPREGQFSGLQRVIQLFTTAKDEK